MRSAVLIMLTAASLAASFGLDPDDFSLAPPGQDLFQPSFSGEMAFSFTSGGGRSFATGAYLGTVGFLLHPTLSAEVDLGYARLFDFGAPDQGYYLGGLGLDWRPSDNLLLQFHVNGVFAGEAVDRNF